MKPWLRQAEGFLTRIIHESDMGYLTYRSQVDVLHAIFSRGLLRHAVEAPIRVIIRDTHWA